MAAGNLVIDRIENSLAEGVDVAGLSKIEDTGKNICTAWVTFDGTTTPPTIIDSHNVSSVARTSTGVFDINFEVAMDNANYSFIGLAGTGNIINLNVCKDPEAAPTVNDFSVVVGYFASERFSPEYVSVQVFGGKA